MGAKQRILEAVGTARLVAGAFIVAVGTRVAGVHHETEAPATSDPDPVDDEPIGLGPFAELGEKAASLVVQPEPRKRPEPEPPLKGSLAERRLRAMGGR